MWGRLKTLVLAAVVAVAALVPLFGDPRSTPVTHPLWARMLLRSLDMTDAVRASTQASQVFATLAWRDSLSYPADRYLRGRGRAGARGGRPGGPRRAGRARPRCPTPWPSRSPATTSCARGSRARRARPRRPRSCRWRGGPAVKSFTLLPAAETGWVFAGSTHLDPGPTRPSSSCPRAAAQPGGDRASLRELDRADGRLEADRRDHEPGPRGDRAQGDRRRARAAAGVDADRDHGRPVPGGGARAGGRGAGEGAGPRRHDAARGPLGAARDRRRSSCRRRASTPCPPSSPPARASAGSRTAAARPWSAPARATGWRPIMSQTFRRRAPHAHPDARRRRDGRAGAAREEEERALGLRRDAASGSASTRGRTGPVARGRALDAMRFVREQRRTPPGVAVRGPGAVRADRRPPCRPRSPAARLPAPSRPASRSAPAARSRRSACRSCPRSRPRRRSTPGS